jgi:voltage-gated potassium channel
VARPAWYIPLVIEDELRAIPLFAAASAAGLAALAAPGVTEVAAGSVLTSAGDPGMGMYVVLDGSVVVDAHGGRFEIGAGGFFGELALIVPNAERVARVRAVTAVRLLPIARPTFETLLETEPSFVLALLREVAGRFVALRGSR